VSFSFRAWSIIVLGGVIELSISFEFRTAYGNLLHGLHTSLTRGTRGLVVVCLKSGTGGDLSAGLSRSVGCRPVSVSSTSLLSVVGDRGDFQYTLYCLVT
jgi:hypothetical protein